MAPRLLVRAVRYVALACDHDETIAHEGRVAERTLAALERLRGSGRRIVLVTGRILADLQQMFDRFGLFDRVGDGIAPSLVMGNRAARRVPRDRRRRPGPPRAGRRVGLFLDPRGGAEPAAPPGAGSGCRARLSPAVGTTKLVLRPRAA